MSNPDIAGLESVADIIAMNTRLDWMLENSLNLTSEDAIAEQIEFLLSVIAASEAKIVRIDRFVINRLSKALQVELLYAGIVKGEVIGFSEYIGDVMAGEECIGDVTQE